MLKKSVKPGTSSRSFRQIKHPTATASRNVVNCGGMLEMIDAGHRARQLQEPVNGANGTLTNVAEHDIFFVSVLDA